jgi:hypothetical protein
MARIDCIFLKPLKKKSFSSLARCILRRPNNFQGALTFAKA